MQHQSLSTTNQFDDCLNDRVDRAYWNLDEEREKFVKTLENAMNLTNKEWNLRPESEHSDCVSTPEANQSHLPHHHNHSHTAELIDEATGGFTHDFRTELQLISQKQLEKLDKIENAWPSQDLFGILRRKCEVCLDNCSGYQPQTFQCPSQKKELDFPTYCLNCECPGCFHSIVKAQSGLSEPTAQIIRSYNITQQDFNFNATLLMLELKNVKRSFATINALAHLLKEEGLEVLSLQQKRLDIKEAMFLRQRQLQLQDENMTLLANRGFDKDKEVRANFIKRNGSSVFCATIRNNLSFMDQTIRNLEQSERMKAQRILDSKGAAFDQIDKNILAKSLKQGRTTDETNSSEDMNDRYLDNANKQLSTGLLPRKSEKKRKVMNNVNGWLQKTGTDKLKPSQQKGISTEDLISAVQRSPELADMLHNEYLIFVVSSTLHTQLDQIIKNTIFPCFFELVSREDIDVAYLSSCKIDAFEDSLVYAPSIFKIHKSVIFSEPSGDFFDIQNIVQQRAEKERECLGQGLASFYKAEVKKQLITIRTDKIHETMRNKLSQAVYGGGAQQKGQVDQLTKLLRTATLKKNPKPNSQTGASLLPKDADFGETGKSLQDKFSKNCNTKWTTSDPEANRLYLNFGSMLDFFDYSGVVVQHKQRAAFTSKPSNMGYKILENSRLMEEFNWGVQTQNYKKKYNMFSVARVGTPNMIFPVTLDVSIKNFQDTQSFIQVSDYFFPENTKSQFSLIVIRPIIVKHGLNDMFAEILRANDFIILKRKLKKLSKAEASLLCQLEHISKENIELFVDTVIDGPSEIIVVSKLGAVQDAKTLCNGSETGRRRTSQGKESLQCHKKSSLSSVFEISPFSSFNELIDLEDFLAQKSRIGKYKKDTLGSQNSINALYAQKIQEIRLQLNSFQRSFSMAALAAPTEDTALQLMSVFTPKLAKLQDLIYILNPIYNHLITQVEELLVRMRYKFVYRGVHQLDKERVSELLDDKFDAQTSEGKGMINLLTGQDIHIFHLVKVAANVEIRKIFEETEATLEDHLIDGQETLKEFEKSLLPHHLPYLLFYMDSEKMYEDVLKIIYGPEHTNYTGRDFLQKLSRKQIEKILEISLFTTAGDPILKVVYDSEGVIVPFQQLKQKDFNKNVFQSNICRPKKYDTAAGPGQSFLSKQGSFEEEFQFKLMTSLTQHDNSSVRFIVEGDSHVLYEIRFHRINYHGDISTANFGIWEMNIEQEDDQEDDNDRPASLKRKVTFEDKQNGHGSLTKASDQDSILKENLYFFERFHTLNFYYSQMSLHNNGSYTPNFYRFQMNSSDGQKVNRVFEVEEFAGKIFMEEAAQMHAAHIRLKQHVRDARAKNWQDNIGSEDEQMSLPAFVLGRQLALMCKELEKVHCHDQALLEGAGDLVYSHRNQVLRGSVKNIKVYFKADQERYRKMLSAMRSRWFLYLSVLETEIIEAKMQAILDSMTFKYTRQPENLSLIPDRMTESSLRLASTIKLMKKDVMEQNDKQENQNTINIQKVFKDIYNDPNRSKDLRSTVQSVMNALDREPSIEEKSKNHNKVSPQAGQESSYEDYTVHRHVKISGVEVAKRPKYQLVASILYLVNFWFRKVHRRVELFQSDRRNLASQEAAKEYDQVLEAIVKGIEQNYGKDEINYPLDLVKLRTGSSTVFEAVLREKAQKSEQYKLLKNSQIEEVKRQQRNAPIKKTGDKTIDDETERKAILKLLDQEVRKPNLESEKAQFNLLKKFLKQRAPNQGLTLDEEDKFRQLIEQSKTNLGKYSLRIAEEFLTKAQLGAERQTNGRDSIQEKISMVKMEYFLYTFTEVYRLMQQLQQMGLIIKEIDGEIQDLRLQKSVLTNKMIKTSTDLSRGSNPYHKKAIDQLKAEVSEIDVVIDKQNRKIDDVRYQMASIETELLQVFRELITYDYFAPEHYFDGDRVVFKEDSNMEQKIVVPLATFWRPVVAPEHQIDPLSNEAKQYALKVQPDDLEELKKRCHFNAPAIKKLVRNQVEKSTLKEDQSSGPIEGPINLREVKTQDFPATIEFEKYQNPSYQRETSNLHKMSQKLWEQTTTDTDGSSRTEKDPFKHLRNKEMADNIISECVDSYLSRNPKLILQSCLSAKQCKELALATLEKMERKKLKFDAYTDQNFSTSYRLYSDSNLQAIDKAQLKNFLKSLAEV